MSNTKKLQAIDVKNEVKRIKKLPKEEQEEQMDALHDKIKIEIDTYYDNIDTMTLNKQNSEYFRVTSCIWAHKFKWEMQLYEHLSARRSEWSKRVETEEDYDTTVNTEKMQAKDVENEVKRIENLPVEEQEGQMDVLYNKIKNEIDTYYYQIDTMNTSEQDSKMFRLLRCISAHSEWEAQLWEYLSVKKNEWSKSTETEKETENNARRYQLKAYGTHISGLPLPKQAKVDVWWQDNKLIFASAATEFSLPSDRVMGMGTTWESKGGASVRTYLTIEYKKEDEMNYIVISLHLELEAKHLIKSFNKIKAIREVMEMNKQEL